MKWVHGELLDADNVVCQFRYGFNGSLQKCLEDITTRYMKDSEILWYEEGFIPNDTSKWKKWSANSNPVNIEFTHENDKEDDKEN